MDSDSTPNERRLVPVDEHQLARRSATLVRRGLNSISEQATRTIVAQSIELTSLERSLLDRLLVQGPLTLDDLFSECFVELEP